MSLVIEEKKNSQDCPPAESQATEQQHVRSLMEVFAAVGDGRRPKGVRFSLSSVLALAFIAVLAGMKNAHQIAFFAKKNPTLLRQLGFRPPKRPRRKEMLGVILSPSHDSIERLLDLVDTGEFSTLVAKWAARRILWGQCAAIDGKALRGSGDYVLSVYVNALAQTVWQEGVGRKENELSALERSLPEILEKCPKVRLFTGDAGFCHKSIVKTLHEDGRDYLLQLKEPHSTDVKLARDAMRQLTNLPPLAKTVEKRGE